MSKAKVITVRKRVFVGRPEPRFEVDCGMVLDAESGKKKRLQKFFRTRKLADQWADEQREKLKAHGGTALALSERDRILFQAERDRLAAAGATVSQAVDFYLAHHKPLKASLPLGELLRRCTLEKEMAGLRPHSVSQFACSCNSFLRGRERKLAHEVTRDEVKGWLFASGFAPKTMRTYLGDVRALFSWAVQERYLARNPVAGEEGFIQLPALPDDEIAAFDPEQCALLLGTALFGKYRALDRKTGVRSMVSYRPLLGFLAIAMFLGVRPEEIRRTRIERLDMAGRTLVITAEAAKRTKLRKRQRRPLNLEKPLLAWLRLWRWCCPGAPIVPVNFDRHWKALRKASGPSLQGEVQAEGKERGERRWPHDVLRHTFATMHYAHFENRSALQAVMGHSEDEDTLDRHYRAVITLSGKVVSKRLAAEFWALTPKRVRKLWEASTGPVHFLALKGGAKEAQNII